MSACRPSEYGWSAHRVADAVGQEVVEVVQFACRFRDRPGQDGV
jgi:hypothetical protein